MKKSVIIIIGLIYIASIVLIGFLGMTITAYDEKLYVTRIECTNISATEGADGVKSIKFNFDPLDATGEKNVLQLDWKVYPENATNRSVNFVYNTESTVGSVDKYGRVFLYKTGLLVVYIESLDGSGISESINIISRVRK